MEKQISYIREAFKTPWNFGILGVLLILGSLIRFHPYFLLFSVAVELGTLTAIASNKRFRRAIRARTGAFPVMPDFSELDQLKKTLDDDHLSQFRKFEEICRQIRQNADIIDEPRSSLLGVALSKLEQFGASFLRMLASHQNYVKYLSQIDRERIVQEITRIDRDIEGRSGRVAELKLKNREILSQRLERIEKARENREVVEAELDVMINTINLLRDQTISITDPQGISLQIDTVLENMRDTDELVREIDSFMTGSLNRALPDSDDVSDLPVRDMKEKA